MNLAPDTFPFWTDFLRMVWCPERHHLIDVILNAGRVRENWLQGDVFLAARTSKNPQLPYFYCNQHVKGFGGSADWSYWDSHEHEADDPSHGAKPLMLAEVKVLGGDYFPKMFAGQGFDLDAFLRLGKQGYCIKPGHMALSYPKLEGFVEDYRRLASYCRCACPVRMLVLVLDTRYCERPLGQCLKNVEFENPGLTLIETPNWLCKVWEIKETIR